MQNTKPSIMSILGRFFRFKASRHAKGYCTNRTKPGKRGRSFLPCGFLLANMTLPTGYQAKLAERIRSGHRAFDAEGFQTRAAEKRRRKQLLRVASRHQSLFTEALAAA